MQEWVWVWVYMCANPCITTVCVKAFMYCSYSLRVQIGKPIYFILEIQWNSNTILSSKTLFCSSFSKWVIGQVELDPPFFLLQNLFFIKLFSKSSQIVYKQYKNGFWKKCYEKNLSKIKRGIKFILSRAISGAWTDPILLPRR